MMTMMGVDEAGGNVREMRKSGKIYIKRQDSDEAELVWIKSWTCLFVGNADMFVDKGVQAVRNNKLHEIGM